nr:thiamine pyrophosphate-dependent enzyme [Desulforamulus reducens]
MLNPDFALFAKSCGGVGYRVEKCDQLEQVFTSVLSFRKPAIIDVISSDTMVPGTKIN